jgi:hypothetical protein
MIDAAFEADPDLARQLDMNRARTRRNRFNRLRHRKLLVFAYAHRQQLDRVRRCRSQLAVAIEGRPEAE